MSGEQCRGPECNEEGQTEDGRSAATSRGYCRSEETSRLETQLRKGTCPYKVYSLFEGAQGVTHYKLEGRDHGELVIGFHGLNGTRSTWQNAARDLVRVGYQVLTYDLYGHGLSSCPPYDVFGGYNYSLEFFVDQLEELLDHLDLLNRPCNLVAFSLGCLVACGFAAKHTHRILRLVLISPAGMLDHKPRTVKTLLKCHCLIPLSPLCVCRCCFNEKSFKERCQQQQQHSGAEGDAAQLMWERIMWNLFEKQGTVPAFLGTLTRLPIWTGRDLYRRLKQTDIAVLLLWGASDTIVPIEIANAMLEEMNNAHLIIFPGCTHLLLSERANECTACIATFLEFPRHAKLDDFQYLLPFTAAGHYLPPKQRAPPGMKQETYLEFLKYKPRRWFKIRKPLKLS